MLKGYFRKIIIGILATLAFAIAIMLHAIYIEPTWYEVKEVPVKLPHLAKAFDGYKIVQITDIHADRFFKVGNLSEIVRQINAQKPDLVVLTGDYITKGDVEPAVGAIADSFRQIVAPDGVLAVLGNHDYWTNNKLVTKVLSQYQIRVLKNELFTLQRNKEELVIAGIDDVWSGKGRELSTVLQQLGTKKGAIALVHEPDFADETAATKQFDLQLSGHSHGGQVRLPFSDRVLPYLGRKYPYGRYQVGEMIQYTSNGIGMGGLPVRLNCRPEITSIVLHAS
jgi:uncharacterized protein